MTPAVKRLAEAAEAATRHAQVADRRHTANEDFVLVMVGELRALRDAAAAVREEAEQEPSKFRAWAEKGYQVGYYAGKEGRSFNPNSTVALRDLEAREIEWRDRAVAREREAYAQKEAALRARIAKLEDALREAAEAVDVAMSIVEHPAVGPPNWDWLRQVRRRARAALDGGDNG